MPESLEFAPSSYCQNRLSWMSRCYNFSKKFSGFEEDKNKTAGGKAQEQVKEAERPGLQKLLQKRGVDGQ